MLVFAMLQPITETRIITENKNLQPIDNHTQSEHGDIVFSDHFNSSLGYNDTLWNLESYGNGSVSWVGSEYLNMSAERHSYRTLSSKQTFEVGHEMNLRMRMVEGETVVCIGWTNQTPTTGWNYLFGIDSVYIEGAQSALLLTHRYEDPPQKTFKLLSGIDATEFHDYRLVWNSSVLIAYVDDERLGTIGEDMPDGPLHFKIAITECRNQTTEGWILLDSIEILEHTSMITENPPFITLNSPGNGTLNLGGDPIEVVPIGSNGTLNWSWDGSANSSGVSPYNIRLPYSEGIHTLDVYCKDGYGYNSWDHARYVFTTMVTPPLVQAMWLPASPTIDGVISPGEWHEDSTHQFELIRADGLGMLVNISIGCDSTFFYIAIDSPVPSGHDSRAAVIVSNYPDGHYHGSNVTPITTSYYTMGSPDAWEGYTELKYLAETSEGIIQPRIEPPPNGFKARSSVQGLYTHYEFRFPLRELDASWGTNLGISFMLFPTGMGFDGLYYPIVYPWENASRLALVRLPVPPDTILIQLGVAGVIGFVAVALYFTYQRRPRGVIHGSDPELIERISSIIESYDRITIERLSQITNTSEEKIREIVEQLIEHQGLQAKVSDEEIIRGD
jgi:hypothetical protein